MLDPNVLIYIPYPRVNCLKTIPFTVAHTFIAHIWQYLPCLPRGYVVPKLRKISLSTTASFFCPQGGHCGEVQLYLKIPWKSKIIMYTYMQLCSMFDLFFSFSGRRLRFVLNSVGVDPQMFKSGSNNRGVAEVKDIMATGKRSQVARLVCEPLLVILLNFRKRFSSGTFADTGQEVI